MKKSPKCGQRANAGAKALWSVWAKACERAILATVPGSRKDEKKSETLLAGRAVMFADPRRKSGAVMVTNLVSTSDGVRVYLHTSFTPNEGHLAEGVAQVVTFAEVAGGIVKLMPEQPETKVVRACGCEQTLTGGIWTNGVEVSPEVIADGVGIYAIEAMAVIRQAKFAEVADWEDARQMRAISHETTEQFYNYAEENYGDQMSKKKKRKA